jgi:hypothetical protein
MKIKQDYAQKPSRDTITAEILALIGWAFVLGYLALSMFGG